MADRLADAVLKPAFTVARLITSPTIVRLQFVLILLPIYLVTNFFLVLPTILRNLIRLLFRPRSWHHFVSAADAYRKQEATVAEYQLFGSFQFKPEQIVAAPTSEIKLEANWIPRTESFTVCGASVSVVHETPPGAEGLQGKSTKLRRILLLHGNPSWSFMWRDVVSMLCDQGYEVFALDWLGHGLSDKILVPELITLELHQRTLLECIRHFGLEDAVIVAHDWGGCIASAALAELDPITLDDALREEKSSSRRYSDFRWSGNIIFLNSFFPPRPSDISWNSYGLFLLWFLSTGIMDGFMPEWAVMRYMSPCASADVVRGYEAPFKPLPSVRGKASVTRFAHMAPGFPDMFYFGVRQTWLWRFFEALVGPESFTNINAQARMAALNAGLRKMWAHCGQKDWKVQVVFGRQDPLLADFKAVLEQAIDKKALQKAESGGWIDGAGHYPVEERPDAVAESICKFVDVALGRSASEVDEQMANDSKLTEEVVEKMAVLVTAETNDEEEEL